jgi:hypothetical protein
MLLESPYPIALCFILPCVGFTQRRKGIGDAKWFFIFCALFPFAPLREMPLREMPL